MCFVTHRLREERPRATGSIYKQRNGQPIPEGLLQLGGGILPCSMPVKNRRIHWQELGNAKVRVRESEKQSQGNRGVGLEGEASGAASDRGGSFWVNPQSIGRSKKSDIVGNGNQSTAWLSDSTET